MAAVVTPLGPGTITVGTAPLDFSCEVVGAKITHEYEEISEAKTRLCGTAIPAQEERRDGFTAEIENDLTAAGLYAFLQTNDLTTQDFSFVPNTGVGAVTQASWDGQITAKLPADIGADEYGQPIASSVEWPAVGALTFTAAADA